MNNFQANVSCCYRLHCPGASYVPAALDRHCRPGTLARLAPLLLQHGMLSFSSPDVLKFLGHRINVSGQIPGNYEGELTTDFKSRASGDRVKYRIDGNSLKGYGKASTPVGDLFRVET